MSSDPANELADLIAAVLSDTQPMTTHAIAKALQRRSVKTHAERVTRILLANRRRFPPPPGRILPTSREVAARRGGTRGRTQQGRRCGSCLPYRPTPSGSAAAPLAFREDDPPTNAMGRAV
jgi:hypothetical protein